MPPTGWNIVPAVVPAAAESIAGGWLKRDRSSALTS